jgi:hypothetical protein
MPRVIAAGGSYRNIGIRRQIIYGFSFSFISVKTSNNDIYL